MPTAEEKLLKVQEEARIKFELTGLRHAKCKKHGVLPINMFYLVKNKDGEHKPLKMCKQCVKKNRPSFKKSKRRVYQKRANKKISQKRREDPVFASKRRADARIKAEKARLNLEDSYIIKLLTARGKMKAKDVKRWMIDEKRAEIIAERERLEKLAALKKIGAVPKRSTRKNRDNLDDCYVRQLLRLSGIKNEDITPEMIEERRAQTLKRREDIKKNGKYASQSQKLSPNYLRLVASSKTGLPKEQITEEMLEETKQRILERRERLNIEPKSAEARIKFQYAKRNNAVRKKKEQNQ